MRAINKTTEPRSLTTHRMTAHSYFGNLSDSDKQELRDYLVREQGGLCCYCMSRLHASRESMKIEHWRSQQGHPSLQLVYGNLLGACLGGEGQPEERQHCDTRKGSRDIKLNPANLDHRSEQRIQFDVDGAVRSNDFELNAQLNEVLGLNLSSLKNRRKAALEGMADWLKSYCERNKRNPDVNTLQRARSRKLPSTGQLDPFVYVAIWWLDQRIQRSAT
jgi:uncharacterized protein (TIGR02646 family)